MAWEPVLSVRDGSDGKESACNGRDPGLTSGSEDPLEKGMATHSRTLAWRIPRTEKPCRLHVRRIRHDRGTNTFTSHFKAKGERGHANIKVVSINFKGHHIHLKQWSSIGSNLTPQGTVGDIWRHFCLSQFKWERDATTL